MGRVGIPGAVRGGPMSPCVPGLARAWGEPAALARWRISRSLGCLASRGGMVSILGHGGAFPSLATGRLRVLYCSRRGGMCRSSGTRRSAGLGNPGFAPGVVIRASSGGVIRDREPWRLLEARSPTSWIADPRAQGRGDVHRIHRAVPPGPSRTNRGASRHGPTPPNVLARRPFGRYRISVEGCRRRPKLPPVGATAQFGEHYPSASRGVTLCRDADALEP
jgi:hypothetical protein